MWNRHPHPAPLIWVSREGRGGVCSRLPPGARNDREQGRRVPACSLCQPEVTCPAPGNGASRQLGLFLSSWHLYPVAPELAWGQSRP